MTNSEETGRSSYADIKPEPITITIHKGGTAEKQIPLDKITVPDCWHAAMNLLNDRDNPAGKHQGDTVLKCWYLAHALLDTLKDGLADATTPLNRDDETDAKELTRTKGASC